MKAFLLLGLLTAFVAGNLLLNFYAPNGVKLLLVPVFGLVFVIALGTMLRRPS